MLVHVIHVSPQNKINIYYKFVVNEIPIIPQIKTNLLQVHESTDRLMYLVVNISQPTLFKKVKDDTVSGFFIISLGM